MFIQVKLSDNNRWSTEVGHKLTLEKMLVLVFFIVPAGFLILFKWQQKTNKTNKRGGGAR